MPSRIRLAFALGSLIGLFASPGRATADDVKERIKAGQDLLKEGDTLADKGETTEAVIRYKRAMEVLLPCMRGLPFNSEVKRDVTKRENMQAMLIKEIDAEMTPEQFRANELGMKAVGLLPKNVNLKQVMVKVYADEIAAFYDPKTKTMHLIKEPEAKEKKQPTFLERLLGKKAGFDKDENKTVIAHEMTHALDDQHFDIDKMQKLVKDDDDRDLALSALIEGEATLTMMGAQMEDWKGREIINVPSATLDSTMSLMMKFMPMMGGKNLREAPVILSETMIFPYLRGLVFCARLTNDGGWKALDEAYQRPPLSTEQIIHPEKYRAKPDLPMAIDLGKLDAGAGWKELGRNVVGEMQLAVLLRAHGGKKAAAGWDGDRYAVFEGPEGKLGLVWFSTWDSEEDAREFLHSYADYFWTKLNGPDPGVKVRSDSYWIQMKDESVYTFNRTGVDVAIVEGFPAKVAGKLLESALKAKKTEMTYPPAPASPAKPEVNPAAEKAEKSP